MKTETASHMHKIAQADADETPPHAAASLAGRRAWIISDGVAGHLAITRGVAETLELDAEVKPVAQRAPWRHLAPIGPADPQVMKALLAEGAPEIVFGAGRQTVPVMRALKRAGAFTVLFQSPRASLSSAHLIWAPTHDRLRGANVITTLTPPHRFTARALDGLRRRMPDEIAALPRPRLALLLGGPGAGYRYDPAAIVEFAARLSAIASHAGGFLITPSRRTPPALLNVAAFAARDKPRLIWNGEGENPYPFFLAAADRFIVTADSVNMTGEACATGKPVHVFFPPGGRAKFRQFHQALRDHGATRPLDETTAALESWTYTPLSAAETVAAEIARRWLLFQSESHGH
jgi:hypothetical protein